jgi:hypothetical protein
VTEDDIKSAELSHTFESAIYVVDDVVASSITISLDGNPNLSNIPIECL